MVEWFAEWVLEQIIKPIWNALNNALAGTLDVIFSALFGVNFQELLEQYGGNIITAFLSLFYRYYITWLNNLLHGLLVAILFVVDIVAAGFNVISGMSKMQVRTASGWTEQYLIDFLFDSSGVSMAFLGVMLLGIILCVMLTLFMLAKSMLDIDNQRPPVKVMAQTGRALLIYLLLPFIVTAGIKLSSLVLVKSAEIVSGGAGNVSMGTYIYAAVIQDAPRDHVPNEAEMVAEEVMNYLSKGAFALFEMRIKLLFLAADESSRLAESLIETGGEPQYTTFPELKRVIAEAKKANRPLRDAIIEEFLSGKGSPSMKALGFGGMPYLNLYYTSQLLKVERVHSAIGIVCAVLILIFMFMATWIAVRKLFEIILLYIISPYYVAFIPLDDGELFNKWRDVFITKIGLGFGIVLSSRIFLLLVPVIFSQKVMLSQFFLLDSILRMVLLIALVFSIIKGNNAITKILEDSSSARGGADFEGEASKMGMAAIMKPISMAKQGVNSAVNSATSGKQRMSGGSQMAMGKPGLGDTSGNGRTFTGTSQTMVTSGKGGQSEQGARRSRTEGQAAMKRDNGQSAGTEPRGRGSSYDTANARKTSGSSAADARNPAGHAASATARQSAGQSAATTQRQSAGQSAATTQRQSAGQAAATTPRKSAGQAAATTPLQTADNVAGQRQFAGSQAAPSHAATPQNTSPASRAAPKPEEKR